MSDQSLLSHLRELRDQYGTNDSAMLLVMVRFVESIGKDDEAAGFAEGECERMDEEWEQEDLDSMDENDDVLPDDDEEDDDRPTEPCDATPDLVTRDYVEFFEYGMNKGAVVRVRPGVEWTHEVNCWMEQQGFFPNVWYQGERGDWNLLDVSTGEFAKP